MSALEQGYWRADLGDHADNEALLLNAVRLDGVGILKDLACSRDQHLQTQCYRAFAQ